MIICQNIEFAGYYNTYYENQNYYYYHNIFLEKRSYQLPKKQLQQNFLKVV